MRVGVNCYGLKRAFYQDYDGTLERLKAIGFISLTKMIPWGIFWMIWRWDIRILQEN